MHRLFAYSTKTPTGTSVDVDGMLLDLITVLKASGRTKEDFLHDAAQMWDDTQVRTNG